MVDVIKGAVKVMQHDWYNQLNICSDLIMTIDMQVSQNRIIRVAAGYNYELSVN